MDTNRKSLFSSLPLRSELLTSLSRRGFESMTPIQQEGLPVILNGQDLIAQAKTGSGKTACFALGLLQSLTVGSLDPKALVLCPTRELAEQVGHEIRKLANAMVNVKVLTVYGGVPLGGQIRSLQHGADIVVGTPGRVSDLLRKNFLSLRQIKIAVLDEADRMLDMGFFDSIQEVLDQTPAQKQTLLFSATFAEEIKALCDQWLPSAKTIKVAAVHHVDKIKQKFFSCEAAKKLAALESILLNRQPEAAMVFCNTRDSCESTVQELRAKGFYASSLHGGMEQKERDEALLTFANGSVNVLVVTDVAARGLDIKGLDLVVNFDLSRDPEVYIHRIGRTGRQGAEGHAVALVKKSESYKINAIKDRLGFDIPLENMNWGNGQRDPKMTAWQTININLGKKAKIRPGDILGTLTSGERLDKEDIGKIHVFPYSSYVAIRRHQVPQAKQVLAKKTIKKRQFRMRVLQVDPR